MKLENEKLIRRFLFGEMSEGERFEFEERFIIDAVLFEETKVVEDELIEKYVRGWMDSAERSNFENYFLTTNKRRERVEFSRQMIVKIEKKKKGEAVVLKKNEEVTSDVESIWGRLAAIFSTPKFALVGAMGLIIAVLGSWFIYKNLNETFEIVKNENNQDTENTRKLETPNPITLPVNSSENNQTNTENPENSINREDSSQKIQQNSNENLNKIPDKTEKKIKATPTPAKPPTIPKIAPNPVLALFAGTVRSVGKNNVLNLPKEAKGAALQLNLETSDYKIYLAQLTDADGSVILQRGNLIIRKLKLNFFIPANKLKKGDYIVKLFGKNEANENESVADFQFRVN